jgi:hypothetical protein
MRQGQHSHNHNKRSRGRGRGGRPGGSGGGGGGGGGNPINRVYESNGPDVKVRGTAQTIAEKYMQLARDAHSSGDTVMAESYNQHAEHYLRILAAAQAYNQQHMPQQQYRRPMGGEEISESFEEGGEGESETTGESEAPAQPFTADSTPAAPGHQAQDNDQRPQGRRPEDRPRQQFDRMRNGGDQPRQPRVEDEADGWDGPQPQFLRRPSGPQGQANGGDRQQRDRRPMRERGPRTRDEQSSAAPEGTDAAPPPSDTDGPAVS